MKKRSLFTLIELIVVIAVLGILSAIIIPNISSIQSKAIETASNADYHSLQVAVDMYALDKQMYPVEGEPTDLQPAKLDFNKIQPDYIRSLPKDNTLMYWVDANGLLWASTVDSPKVTNSPTGLVTWTAVEGAEGYRVYEVQSGSSTASAAKKERLTFKVVKSELPKEQLSYQGEVGKVYVVSAIDKKKNASAPIGVNTYQSIEEGGGNGVGIPPEVTPPSTDEPSGQGGQVTPNPEEPISTTPTTPTNPTPPTQPETPVSPPEVPVTIVMSNTLTENNAVLNIQTNSDKVKDILLRETTGDLPTESSFIASEVSQGKNESGNQVYQIVKSGLTAGIHTFSALLVDGNGKPLGQSNEVTVSVVKPVIKPVFSGVALTSAGKNIVKVDFSLNTDVEELVVSKRVNGTIVGTIAVSNTSRSFTDAFSNSDMDATSISYEIKASNGTETTTTTSSVPMLGTPTLTKGTVKPNSVDLSGTSNGANRMELYINRGSGREFYIGVNASSGALTVTGLDSNKDYTFDVVASNGFMTKTSASLPVKTLEGAPSFSTPSVIQPTTSSVGFNLTGYNIANYTILSSTGATLATGTGNNISYTATGMKQGESRTFTVKGYNNSGASVTTTITLKSAWGSISTPTISLSKAGGNYLNLNVNVSNFNRADVYVNGVKVTSFGIGGNQIQVFDLNLNTTYSVYVKLYNDSYSSSNSNTISTRTNSNSSDII